MDGNLKKTNAQTWAELLHSISRPLLSLPGIDEGSVNVVV